MYWETAAPLFVRYLERGEIFVHMQQGKARIQNVRHSAIRLSISDVAAIEQNFLPGTPREQAR